MSDLFDSPAATPPQGPRPLADRLRPRSLSEVIGQSHVLSANGPLGAMLAAHSLSSLILWGPPGVGKTTIARLLAHESDLAFVQISAIFTGVPDLRKVFESAKIRRQNGQGTLLFVDEIHRFNKAQQDGFLPYMEDGTILLVGATTENPSFELNAAVLSRAQVIVLERLTLADLELMTQRAEKELGRALPLDGEAREAIIEMADGDGRALLNLIEQVAAWKLDKPLTRDALATRLTRRASKYDKSGEEHYNLISALHKSVRGSDPDAALYWFAQRRNQVVMLFTYRICGTAQAHHGSAVYPASTPRPARSGSKAPNRAIGHLDDRLACLTMAWRGRSFSARCVISSRSASVRRSSTIA